MISINIALRPKTAERKERKEIRQQCDSNLGPINPQALMLTVRPLGN